MPNCAATWATTAATFHVDTYETTLGDTLVDCARLSNATTNANCMAAHANHSDCVFAATVFPFVTAAPMFVLEGAYDSWQLANVMGFPCATYFQPLVHCTAHDNATLEAYGHAMKLSIQHALNSSDHHRGTAGAFVSHHRDPKKFVKVYRYFI